ncbi:hypothetical protein CcaverHIS002_0400960 [Cutaneotrichosporon cavernicola]|uniref:RlpA-like protein double-psi beta-barrel domain-containing protein n=1 Tax=Cutaneotrichosporon cavernicola TaxID=279322 RepID=A0AA48L3I5_9TREE|nr:uncharacterized protein CcaverHIS019_0400930 [Cutaneotrichosporon cavernicola]BEI83492.1 hypothetical protein CcaverHIS002_0400960 [Cutaneotrichosporon cavernicola]BEI91273.1 hypothetical protein CcaverHIS019_0400930 [Cutaneotrichosporon cavernicola]BEI99046.1 hypothetical protein CcaverHIS631_0400890 [Cutaneotrichosporon cavernicola]BEJ06820.1 hypothetical protein CcaverHIS641_0400890 [Cutaneotrichosporon cavernicola]
MKFTTFALFTALAAVVTAAPTPEAYRGGNRHGHKYGGQRKYGHSHKQPQADAPATTDEWDENEPCVDGTAPPVLNNIATPSSSSAISSASAVSSTAEKPSSSSTEEASPTSSEEAPKETPKWDEDKPEDKPQEKPAKEEDKPKEVDNGGGKGIGSNGGQSGFATRYSVMNPSENHGMSGQVACYTLNRNFNDGDRIAAVPIGQFNLDMCGKTVNVCAEKGCVDVMIVDSCVGGGCKDLDITPAAFDVITGDNTGIYPITYKWL